VGRGGVTFANAKPVAELIAETETAKSPTSHQIFEAISNLKLVVGATASDFVYEVSPLDRSNPDDASPPECIVDGANFWIFSRAES